MTKKGKFLLFLISFSVTLLIIGVAVSLFFLVYDDSRILGTHITEPTPTFTPTPTPIYQEYLNRPANYVGEVIEAENSNQITLKRHDSSRLILSLQPDISIYVLRPSDPTAAITIEPISGIRIGDTLSVYTENKDIHAIFLLK